MESVDEMRLEFEQVTSRSRVWTEKCVGKVMCCTSEKASRRLRKEEEEGQRGVNMNIEIASYEEFRWGCG